MRQTSFSANVDRYLERVEAALDRWLPDATTHPARFHTAIRYAVLGGGKRLRPLLVYAAGEWLELAPERLDAIAVAIELAHAYSLAHDDLPALDNHEMCRGRATVHVAFDEATAILVGDALQAHAYNVLASDAALAAAPVTRRELVLELSRASGSQGMAGGRALESDAAARDKAPAIMEQRYHLTTGRLLRATLRMPCRLAGGSASAALAVADRFADALGLAVPIADDLIEVKSAPARTGPDGARHRLGLLRAQAYAALSDQGSEADGLRWLFDHVAIVNG